MADVVAEVVARFQALLSKAKAMLMRAKDMQLESFRLNDELCQGLEANI